MGLDAGRCTSQARVVSDAHRRPIAARKLHVVEASAQWLIQRGVSANAISVAGMVAAVAAGVALAFAPGHALLWLLGAILVPLRLLANMLDGMVAVGSGAASKLGELFNEIPDRVADTAVLAGLGVAAHAPTLGLATALAAIATAYIRAIGKGMGLASDFCGPGAKQQRMAIVIAAALWCAVGPARLAAPVPLWALWLILVLASFTALRRLVRLTYRLQA